MAGHWQGNSSSRAAKSTSSMKQIECDLAVIGGGPAGLMAAGTSARLGARTVLIECAKAGGESLWSGGVPSATLIQSARVYEMVQRAAEFGVNIESPKVRWSAITLRIAAVRDEIRALERARAKELGLSPLIGQARFLNQNSVAVVTKDGEVIVTARRFVLATGAKPEAPSIAGLEECGYMNPSDLYDLPSLPRSLLFIGGGPVACELAHCFARLGTRVTLVHKGSRLLEREDEDVSEAAAKILRAGGVDVHLRATLLEAGRDEKGAWLKLEDEKLRASKIVLAMGKKCDLADLNPDTSGVKWETNGVRVDAYLRAAPTVWACGDVTGGPYSTHRAVQQARIAAQNALLRTPVPNSEQALPRVTYLDPEIASVGLLEREAEAAGAKVYRVPFSGLHRAIIVGETSGFCKILASPSGRILGASIVGAGAGEQIAMLAQCVRDGILMQELSEAVFAYPTMGEITRLAAQQYLRALLKEPLSS